MSFINPITDLNLTKSLPEKKRYLIANNQNSLEEFWEEFIEKIQNKLEFQKPLNITETEFLQNLLGNIYDNALQNGDEYKEIEKEI